MSRTTLLNNNDTISDYTMVRIADYMDSNLYGLVARDCKPCSNECLITEYARRLSRGERNVFAYSLDYAFGLNLDDIAYKAYLECYENKLISYGRLIELKTASPFVIRVEDLGEAWLYNGARAYSVLMISGSFIVYTRE